jgi:sugar phosphate isomerase/epimerase
MKIASQLGLLPGNSNREKFEKAKEIGFEGIELQGRVMLEDPSVVREYSTLSEKTGMKISSICAGYRNYLLEESADCREKSRKDIKELLKIGGELGGAGLILVPVFGHPKISDLVPYKNAIELEEELLLSQLPEIVESAEKNNCALFLEPLNRYETHFMNKLEQATKYCEKIQSPFLKILADFFHMSIEEAFIAESIEKAGKWIAHVHLADSNRILPGMGHTNFSAGFNALKKIGFKQFMALECGVPEPKEKNLKKSLEYIKKAMGEKNG